MRVNDIISNQHKYHSDIYLSNSHSSLVCVLSGSLAILRLYFYRIVKDLMIFYKIFSSSYFLFLVGLGPVNDFILTQQTHRVLQWSYECLRLVLITI